MSEIVSLTTNTLPWWAWLVAGFVLGQLTAVAAFGLGKMGRD